MKPLFIPLKREYFEQFRTGEKIYEYRPYGPRWNERTCTPGRTVTLSLGYGKKHRLQGTIVSATLDETIRFSTAWINVYGISHPRIPYKIHIQLDPQ